MRVREATPADKAAWDAFVDSESGGFCLYFGWKYVHEAAGNEFIPLLIDTASSQLVGVLSIVRQSGLLYSTLDSGSGGGAQGLLLRSDLTDNERHGATTALLEYVDSHYSRRCSSFRLACAPPKAGTLAEGPAAALVDSGFHCRYDSKTGLPCDYVLTLKLPFQENIWKGWSDNFRRAIKKAAKSGVVVLWDQELKYAEDFVVMLSENEKRRGARPPNRDEIMVRLDVFRDRTKLFVALLDDKPIVTLLCHYTPTTCYLARVGSYEKDTDNANKLCWKTAIEDACNTGYRYADLGYTDTESLAFFKERFKGTRVPVRIYEKRYSLARTIMEKTPVLVRSVCHDRKYLWRNRRRIWDRSIRI
ncbi:MAG: GNAT family N-acetyltransferase [Dehalococcoidia bacterium]|nr:GNAT family N-acetyltransferase [Dehalococcoidia bacterium]